MAMLADLNKLRYHGPQALRCRECFKPFEEGMAIEGPSRNRGGYANHTKEYWHANCRHPWGFKPVNGNPTVVVNSSNSNDWQAPATTKAAALPASQTPPAPPYNEGPSLSSAELPSGEDRRQLVKDIAGAVNTLLLPQVEAAVNELESKIDSHIGSNNEHSIAEVRQTINEATSRVKLLADSAVQLAERVAKLEQTQPIIVTVSKPDGTSETRDVGRQHKLFAKLLKRIAAGDSNIQLTGPAGAGKSEAAKYVAKALGYHFELVPMISDPVELLGYMNANGQYVPTNFFRGYVGEKGPTIILLDELDGWDARAGLAANPALANGHSAFPHGTFARGENVVIIAATNTWGFGANDEFVGRNKLDGTTLDRLTTIRWDYDEDFERDLALAQGNADTRGAIINYVSAVQETRALCKQHRAKIQITPRSSIIGAKLLANGISKQEVLEARFERFREHNMWATVGRPLEDWASNAAPTSAPVTTGVDTGYKWKEQPATHILSTESWWSQVRDLMLKPTSDYGCKIKAIQLVRDNTSLGLKEAKEYIERHFVQA